ncbi:MAG: alpha/beta hydrolase-fold protein [Lentimicrobiaceae bacterium]|nr:alpha/beta hydrolase-fold protein [Lentimicrobiaceae bacterium]
MKWKIWIYLILSLPLNVAAQVTFIVNSLPVGTPSGESIYIAGNFNGWNPGHADYVLHKNEADKWEITLGEQATGTVIQFKFTRGSWETVEKGANGEEIPNRTFTYGNGQIVYVDILNWAGGGSGASTAAANVHIMDEAFFMPQLNRSRRIWIYLPPDYESSGKSYPVMYMHDGQNLFDKQTSYAGEWEVDETLNQLFNSGYAVPVVIGIENGGSYRIQEYTPWVNPNYGGGNGEAYAAFIVETLKPYVDAHYRTLPERENTAIMGSSLGGLISHYAALRYPEIFGKAGLFSPSYWFSDSVWAFASSRPLDEQLRIYQMCGSAEGGNTDVNMLRMSDTLVANGLLQTNITNVVVPGGEHNEALWRGGFKDAYLWLFQGAPAGSKETIANGWMLYPNPATEHVYIKHENGLLPDTVVVYGATGQRTAKLMPDAGGRYNVAHLPKGNYILEVAADNKVFQLKFVKL